MCEDTKLPYIIILFQLISFAQLECLSEKLPLCLIYAFRAHQREGWRTEEGVLGYNTLMHTIVLSVERCRWTLTNSASQGRHDICIVTFDKSSSGCSPLMVHHSKVNIHPTFILPWRFHCLHYPMPLLPETIFPPAFCVNTSHAKGKERKVGHGQMDGAYSSKKMLARFYFMFFFFPVCFSVCS